MRCYNRRQARSPSASPSASEHSGKGAGKAAPAKDVLSGSGSESDGERASAKQASRKRCVCAWGGMMCREGGGVKVVM